jgi:ketosteroid isomerase-like protein
VTRRESPIAIVKRAFEAFEQRDVDALTELSDPDIEISSVTGVIAGREAPYTGIAALSDYLADVERIWDQIELDPEEYRDLGEDRVVVFGRVRASRPGGRIDTPNAWLWQLRDGKVVSVKVYAEPTPDASWLFK